MAAGTLAVSPATMSEKKMPIDSGWPIICAVERMPDAAPRLRAGTLFMIAAVLGAPNMPNAMPSKKSSTANAGYAEVGGQQHERRRTRAPRAACRRS